jgi:hypothetical protein
MTKITTASDIASNVGALGAASVLAGLTEAALTIKLDQFEPAFDRHGEAEDRYLSARKALEATPLPAALVVPPKGRTLVGVTMTYSDGAAETRPIPPQPIRLETAQAVLDYCDGDVALAAPYLAALEPWLAATQPLRRRLDRTQQAVRRSEARQLAASSAMQAAALAILAAPALSVGDMLAKIDGYVRVHCDSGRLEDLDGFDCTPLTLALAKDLAKLAQTTLAPPGSDWALAFERHQAVEQRYHALCAEDDDENDRLHRTLDPACRAPGLHQRESIRWLSIEDFDNDVLLTSHAKALLRPQALAAIQQRDGFFRHVQDPERNRRSAELERLCDDKDIAIDELLELPPPTVSALLYTMEKRAWWMDDDKMGLADPGYVAFCLHTYLDQAYPVQSYLDLLHLAGRAYAVPEALTFNPRAWIDAYEAVGGKVGEAGRGLIIAYPEHDTLQARRLRVALAQAPWKYRAVHLAAEQRREQGGDPFHDAQGQVGAHDQRHAARRFDGFVRRADHVVFTRDPVTGAATPHIEHIDNAAAPYVPAAFGLRAPDPQMLAAE